MFSKRIAFIYTKPLKEVVTGGHFYEKDLARILGEAPETEVDFPSLGYPDGIVGKLAAPILLTRHFRRLRKYDLLVFNSSNFLYFLPLLSLLKCFGSKTLVIHHHFLANEQTYAARRNTYRILENLFLRLGTHLLTPSPYIAQELTRLLDISPFLCPVPFDSPERPLSINPLPGQLLFIGTIERRKGLHNLVEALEILKKEHNPVYESIHVTIAGKIIDKSYYEKLLESINLNKLQIRFTGFQTREKLKELMRVSDIFIFPSYQEGFGIAMNEAMAYGLPVICFDNSAMPYSVKNEINGLLVSTGDSLALARGIAKLISDRNMRKRLSEGALRHASTLPRQEDFRQSVNEMLRKILK